MSAPRRTVLAGALSLLSSHAVAQPRLPDRALRILVGFPAGGGSDSVARAIGPGLQRRIGRSVTVENRPGGSGAAMGEMLAKAAPDGSIVGLVASTTLIGRLISPATFPFDPQTDLAPLGMVGTYETVFGASPKIGVASFAEYVQWVKAGPPERRRFGTAAPDTFSTYFPQLLGRQHGLELEPVAYRGAGPLANDIAEGRVPAGCASIASLLHHQRGGRVRLLVTTGAKRSAMLPDVPTIVELGHPELQVSDWYGLFAPAGLPPRLVAAWNRDLSDVVESSEVSGQLTQLGVVVDTTKPDEAAVRLAVDLERWKGLLDMLGIRPAK
ncbi:MAG: hypothetical protein EPO67_01715 [Reyranella sp.]|nr:MAG: hypothetical protein EPO67_01715 [Reyranella sp.]